MINLRSLKRIYYFCILLFFLPHCATTQSQIENKQRGEAHYKLGVSYLNEGKIQQAFIEFQKAISLNPSDKESYNALGLIYEWNLERFDEAEKAYKKAISIDKNFSDAHNNLGVLYAKLKRWDEAIEEYKRALSNPLYLTPHLAYNNLGFALYSKGDPLDAINAYKEALKIQPDFDLAYYNLALSYIKLNMTKEAINSLETAIRITPDFLDAHYQLGLAYFKEDKRELAYHSFKKVIELAPKSEQAISSQVYLELLSNR